ncbi:putative anti-sigma regulatory factor, serine/threonine protein kinase [Desulfatibacillum aliphaticivorans]|uniref:Anti-sigma regulatory factor, serine/threonine protein kinase n=1 Tax=Desulfatibacillum aliphaticivorans TaxID=218208 RepID=B8FK59_DESAL|nr:ATP-binding protein [Desulfatibacillum aliphaticivorans]ACL02734.1 putative anti-sigma regulatory factor, serine/threonine protein kinase [Desulfatibacillum aliphaticivorans]
MAVEIKLVVEADLKQVFLVGLAVNGICSHYPFTKLEGYLIETCVVEAVINVVKHAYEDPKGKELAVICRANKESMMFEVWDWGKGMDGLKPAALDFDPEDVTSLPESGMGLFIIQQVMDEVHYLSRDSKNVLTMTKKFTPQEPPHHAA